MVEAGGFEIGCVDLYIDEVPLTRPLPRAVGIGVSILVRPGRRACDVVSSERVSVGRKQGVDPFADIGIQEGTERSRPPPCARRRPRRGRCVAEQWLSRAQAQGYWQLLIFMD